MLDGFPHNRIPHSSCFISRRKPTVALFYIIVCDSFLRLRQQSIERAIDLTESFTWEDLPKKEADTGHLTAAGWIPLIKMFSTRSAVVLILFHFVQSTVRIATNHETVFVVWYPFDWTVSPYYELVNISQVKYFNLQTWHNSHKNYCNIQNLSVRLYYPPYTPSLFFNYDSVSLTVYRPGWMIQLNWTAFGRMRFLSN
jgi:hypothetical protein